MNKKFITLGTYVIASSLFSLFGQEYDSKIEYTTKAVKKEGIEFLSSKNQKPIEKLYKEGKLASEDVLLQKHSKEIGDIVYYNTLQQDVMARLYNKKNYSFANAVTMQFYTENREVGRNLSSLEESINDLNELHENPLQDRNNMHLVKCVLYRKMADTMVEQIRSEFIPEVRSTRPIVKIGYLLYDHTFNKEYEKNKIFMALARGNIPLLKKKDSIVCEEVNRSLRQFRNEILENKKIASESIIGAIRKFHDYGNMRIPLKKKDVTTYKVNLFMQVAANTLYKLSYKSLMQYETENSYLKSLERVTLFSSFYTTLYTKEQKEKILPRYIKVLKEFMQSYPLDRVVSEKVMRDAIPHFLENHEFINELSLLYTEQLMGILKNRSFSTKYMSINKKYIFNNQVEKKRLLTLHEYVGNVTKLYYYVQRNKRRETKHIGINQKIMKNYDFISSEYLKREVINSFKDDGYAAESLTGVNNTLKYVLKGSQSHLVIKKLLLESNLLHNIANTVKKVYTQSNIEKSNSQGSVVESYWRAFEMLPDIEYKREYRKLGEVVSILTAEKNKLEKLSCSEMKYLSYIALKYNKYLYKQKKYAELVDNYQFSRNMLYSEKMINSYRVAGIEYEYIEELSAFFLNLHDAYKNMEKVIEEDFYEDVKRILRSAHIEYSYEFSPHYWGFKDTSYNKLQILVEKK